MQECRARLTVLVQNGGSAKKLAALCFDRVIIVRIMSYFSSFPSTSSFPRSRTYVQSVAHDGADVSKHFMFMFPLHTKVKCTAGKQHSYNVNEEIFCIFFLLPGTNGPYGSANVPSLLPKPSSWLAHVSTHTHTHTHPHTQLIFWLLNLFKRLF